MTDLVERLRNRNGPYGWLELIDKAADEIVRLRAALKSIADYAPGKSTECLLLRGEARRALEQKP